ncbi:OLC1v1032675C1 [Oldenlandia corymbosa var. corymbosa]|uniref:OLC1v1032675C1 n=1 Tax=Oldenlandia corymbosa var. corymbosa TaxID=529605 RepID=A0AAV1CND5_OLDCO|nr:OLC1v1032675C1 [Oldenlandia corymbosa var. corymbosa]
MTQYMRLFRACTTSRTLTKIHGHLIVTGLHRDPLAATKLIESYAQFGPFVSSRIVFDNFPNPDSFMWGVIIKCHVWNGFFDDSICLYHDMLFELKEQSRFIFPPVLKACSAIGELGLGEKVHGTIIKSLFESDFVIETSLLNMYGDMGCLDSARKIFDNMPVRDVVSLSSIISSYVKNGQVSEGLDFFGEMVKEVSELDEVTMLSVSEACGEMGFWREGKSLHGFVIRRNISIDGALGTSLVAMYAKCGDLNSSEGIFAQAADRSTSLWTAMISCYHQNGWYQEALRSFLKMQSCDVEPNAVTLMCVILSCARLSKLNEGKSVHAFGIKNAVEQPGNDLLGPALVDLYASCGKFRECHRVFDSTEDRLVLLWNMLISSYTREGMMNEASKLFKQMLAQQSLPDSFTLASILSACGELGFSELGCQIHSYALKLGISTEFVQNSLIAMYCKGELFDSAHRVFSMTKQKGIVAWNAIISGLAQNGRSKEALAFFNEMHSNAIEMNDITFLSAIQACSNLGYIEDGKWIHHKLITNGVRNDLYIDTALVDLYAKCGDLQMAQRVFDTMFERSVVSWSILIGAYAVHGQADVAISFFWKMIGSGTRPNEIIFMNILSACRHAGYLEAGKSFFKSMINDFGIEPNFEHYACLVDLLSRAGDLHGAYEIITSMPSPVDASVWGAFINGCRIHQRMDIIESMKENLVNMHTDDTGYHTLLSNLYAEGGEWNEFNTMRSNMTKKGLQKVQGQSMIKIGADDKVTTKLRKPAT